MKHMWISALYAAISAQEHGPPPPPPGVVPRPKGRAVVRPVRVLPGARTQIHLHKQPNAGTALCIRICVMASHVKSGAPPSVALYKQDHHLLGAHGSPTFSAVSAISLQMSSPEADAPMTTTVRPLKASLSR